MEQTGRGVGGVGGVNTYEFEGKDILNKFIVKNAALSGELSVAECADATEAVA